MRLRVDAKDFHARVPVTTTTTATTTKTRDGEERLVVRVDVWDGTHGVRFVAADDSLLRGGGRGHFFNGEKQNEKENASKALISAAVEKREYH